MTISAPGRPRWSRILLAVGPLLAAAGAAAWLTTGREGYTRWPDHKLSMADRPPATQETELLAGIGFDDLNTAPAAQIESRFAFGLVPGGLDLKHMPSVAAATAAGGALFAAGLAIGRRPRSRMKGPRT